MPYCVSTSTVPFTIHDRATGQQVDGVVLSSRWPHKKVNTASGVTHIPSGPPVFTISVAGVKYHNVPHR